MASREVAGSVIPVEADPAVLLLNSPMSGFQKRAIAVTVLLNALDGFDILAVTFAAPGMLSEWGIGRGALGLVIGAGLAGMAIGSLFLAPVADMIGRRRVILGCLTLMALSMLLSATASSPGILSFWRLLTGIGVGAMIASINAISSEYANRRRRELAVGLMTMGYPIGGIVGGVVASRLLTVFDWRSVFVFGGGITLIVLPIVWRALPESLEFLLQRRPADALGKVNRLLVRMNHHSITTLPSRTALAERLPFAMLFGPELRARAAILCAIFFMHTMTTYYFLGWVSQLTADLGFSASQAAFVSVCSSIGGLAGNIALSLLAFRFGARRLTTLLLVGSATAVALFGFIPADLLVLQTVAAAAGFFVFAGNSGLYMILALAFPTSVRASGTGLVIGIGRAGAAIAPVIAGFMLAAGLQRDVVSATMGTASLIGAGLLLLLGRVVHTLVVPARPSRS